MYPREIPLYTDAFYSVWNIVFQLNV